MNIKSLRLSNSRGIVLATTLSILAALLAMGIAIRVMLRNDYRILANLREATQSLYYSIAGIEWSKNELAATPWFPPAPSNQTISFASGSFAITFLSPSAIGPLTAQITVRSVGAKGNATHVSQARLTKTYDLADAAVGIRGNPARVVLNGNGIFISGADHDPANQNILANTKPRYGISTSSQPLQALVIESVGDPAMIDQAGAAPAIAQSDFLSPAMISRFADDLCAAPGATLHPIPSEGILTVDNQLWGNASFPQLHCIDGLSAAGDGVTLAGNVSGVGILIVRNADLIVNGSFHWEGLIIITGQEVALKTVGSSTKEIIGGALINETGAPGTNTAILDVQGSLRLLFSRQALSRSSPLIPSSALADIYPNLPSTISQDYWRTVTP